MAYRCLETLEINGITFNLAQVSDFSIITSAMVSGSTQRYDLRKVANTGVLPSFLSTFGDVILDCQGLMAESWIIGDTNYFAHRMGLYKYNNFESTSYDMFGGITKNFVNSAILSQYGWSKGSTQSAIKSYIAIVLDDENERAYYCYVYDIYKHFGNGRGVYCHVFAGKTNGEDLIWKSFPHQSIIKITSNGGGATHIAKVTGQLKDLSSNLSDILMVSGGGGGGLLVGETEYTGKEAGGISGSGDNSADQSTGNAFGQGESGTNVSGGGSGLYGGYKGTSAKSGGAGSGYIGNSLVSNKKMVGYNIPTSSAESTKTESVNDVSASAVSGKPKSGNGFARIKYMANYKTFTFEELIKTSDLTHYKETWVGQYAIDDNWSTLSQWLDTDWNLASQNGYGTYQLVKDNDEYALGSAYSNAMSLYALPLKRKIKVRAIIFDGKFNTLTNSAQSQMHLRMGCTNNGVHSIVGALTVSQGDGYDYKVTDTNYHTFVKQFNSVETNYLEFYNGQYKDYFKNIKVIVEE